MVYLSMAVRHPLTPAREGGYVPTLLWGVDNSRAKRIQETKNVLNLVFRSQHPETIEGYQQSGAHVRGDCHPQGRQSKYGDDQEHQF